MDSGSVSHKKPFDIRTRNSLLYAIVLGALPGLLLAALLGFAVEQSAGIDLAAGVAIVALPQAWFVTRGTRGGAQPAAAFLALGKYGLVGAGFAIWFVVRPEANLLATVCGTAVTIVLTTVATWWSLARVNKPPEGTSR